MNCEHVVKQIKNSIPLILTTNAEGKLAGTGSAFVFLQDDILVTCNHVVKGANSIFAKFADGSAYVNCELLIQDNEHDLALLKIDAKNRLPLKKSTMTVEEGMPVIFSGYPLGINTLTTHFGILSAVSQDPTGVTTYLIDGTVNPGNSGCPLLDQNGNVIGVVNATRREDASLLGKVSSLNKGAFSIFGLDMIEVYQALIKNLQLGIGYAIPAIYIPEHKTLKSEVPPSAHKIDKKT